MRPIMLKGHERSLTQVKYNKEGDLIFTVAKDKIASVWYSYNGERVGTYNGHQGTIWSIDVDSKSEFCLTGSADFSMKLWEVSTGRCLFTFDQDTSVRRVEFDPYDNRILAVTDKVMGFPGSIITYKINRDSPTQQDTTPLLKIDTKEGFEKVSVAGFSYLGKYIVAGHQDGTISKYDATTGALIGSVKAHEGLITDIQFSEDKTYFIISSKDKSASIYDVDNLKQLKRFEADAPMNSAAITPVKEFVVLGGGQEARDVTTTAANQGKFEARFYHKIFEDEIGRVKGHFGPLNYIAVHPSGSSYASGGEDGYVRVHTFEKSYYDFKYDVEVTAEAKAHAGEQ
ncbi:translation initiation factor eIF3 subunit i [Cyberlindnera jadinii NRRL Y-1542]|uniref:Eukaryotic translation initiation factor 3 subunit I n=1 Tax=Cyberlindnera jadinii (strain ATCC 18201 / CBS 1600 / BCRC 20928 / JCM 3617 / NBRC 0987 / NRRL Y-1542) TaxID=983966 RepID=A0A1E4RUV2_CYBJN|nr:WD40 repeat-like protein [Cyberlindnera jadinii NRRL Y-1542]ODV70845.1 WD40 repeat-like protein [Cyberlindnera jadinii NRRL Y-1542]